jgi:two-component system, OmpR family, phosphate regulon response regulator OmpR
VNPKATILVVDDEPDVREVLEEYFVAHGYAAIGAASASAARAMAAQHPIDVALVDIHMPGEDGLSLARHLRERYASIAIVMLTSAGTVVDRIVGLEMGADDYLPKPFNPRELVARIHAVLRRRQPAPPPGAPAQDEQAVSFGAYTLDLGTRTLTRGKEEVPLTTGEFALLKVLATHPREPLSRDKLMELARGREFEAFDRSIDVQISRLRRLIETDPARPAFIQTVWGFGYVFVPDGRKRDEKPAKGS